MKSYTDLEQSKKLAEFLPLESADMIYIPIMDIDSMSNSGFFDIPECYSFNEFKDRNAKLLPCWSLAVLLNYLREIDFFPNIEADEHGVTMSVCYYDDEEGELLHPMHDITTEADSFVDACVAMILKLHEQKLL